MKKILTIILDGFGYREEEKGNAILAAHMKTFTELWNKYPHALLEASEEAVGLSKGQAGNSEVGHMTIGAGRLLKQSEMLVNDFLKEPDMENANVIKLLENKDKDIHIMGLCSDGNIHAGVDDFLSMYKFLIDNGFTKIHFHLITDGRDTGVHDAMKYINIIKDVIKQYGVGDITSICGRFYAMDRDENWDRTKAYYDLVVGGKGLSSINIEKSINSGYEKGITDEFIKPIICSKNTIKNGDIIMWMNYRADRAKQILSSIVNWSTFDGFSTENMKDTLVFSFLPVDKKIKTYNLIEPVVVKNSLGLYLSELDFTQARIAESEKFPHVTYFFDGGVDGKIKGCDKFHIPSPSVATYDLKPEMSAPEVTEKVVDAINSKKYDVIILNFANPDMVGHTGSLPAAIKAVETIDECVQKVVDAMLAHNGTILITADHGNCEQMIDYKTGEPHTAHTTNPVPLILVTNDETLKVKSGKLADLAPTMLEILGIEKPEEMTGESILEK